MQAVAVRRGESSPSVIEVPRPEPGPGEALVRTLRVGVDGTDLAVLAGSHGGFPRDEDYLVLGHEAVGVVEEPNGTDLAAGAVVVPTVRRPPGESNRYFERGEPDMAPMAATVERGIDGAHGFMAEYFTSPAEYLVRIPDTLAPHGILVEPMSNTEKALELADAARSSFAWEPESVLVLGNGPLGLLALARLTVADPEGRFDRSYCLGRRDRPDPTVDVIERLGATYVDSRETPVPEVPAVHEPMDLVYEATGYAKHAFEAIEALAPTGVATLLGVPDSWTFEIDGGRLHEELVLGNKAVLGSVNSRAAHYRAAAESLAAFPDWLFEALETGVYPPEDCERAFVDDEATIKAAVAFDT